MDEDEVKQPEYLARFEAQCYEELAKLVAERDWGQAGEVMELMEKASLI